MEKSWAVGEINQFKKFKPLKNEKTVLETTHFRVKSYSIKSVQLFKANHFWIPRKQWII